MAPVRAAEISSLVSQAQDQHYRAFLPHRHAGPSTKR
jgi:hypothetical protein